MTTKFNKVSNEFQRRVRDRQCSFLDLMDEGTVIKLRAGHDRIELYKLIDQCTTQRFVLGINFIKFESDVDAMMFQLRQI